MRLAARLLVYVREAIGENTATISTVLIPTHFDVITQCSLKACKETEDEELKNPSTALKLGYDLSRYASAKLGFAIKRQDEKERQEATDFLRLLQMEWGVKVSKLAQTTLQERHFNKPKDLPLPDDIVCISSYLIDQLNKLDLSEPSEGLFREVVLLTETRLLLYNRRRTGELEKLSIGTYQKRSNLDEADLAMRQNLSHFEKRLLESQELVEIRGKTGRGVPLLIPHEVKRMMEFLSDRNCRQKGGIKKDNQFIFAKSGDSVVRAGDALNEVKSRPDVKLRKPSRILATNMRKYTATIAQVLSLNEQEMKWLCNHLGHSVQVHDQYYRQTSGLIERLEVAKMMLLQDNNLVGKYADKKLSEVQIDDIVADIDETNPSTSETNPSTSETQENLGAVDETRDYEDWIHEDFLAEPGRKKSKTPVNRVKWSQLEEDVIRTYFSSYFDKTKNLEKNMSKQRTLPGCNTKKQGEWWGDSCSVLGNFKKEGCKHVAEVHRKIQLAQDHPETGQHFH